MIPPIARETRRRMRSTIVQARCHAVRGVALVLVIGSSAHAQAPAQPASAADPFGRRGWHLELGAHGALETWNYNISHEELSAIRTGITYGLGKGVTLVAGASLY